MKNLILTLILTTCSIASNGFTVNALVEQIAETNRLDYELVGYYGIKSAQYQRYELLTALATLEKLNQLTNHENKVVACYASWGLIDKGYNRLDSVFDKFLKNDHEIETLTADLGGTDLISSTFYHRYWNKLRIESIDEGYSLQNDELLFKMDSMILFENDVYWLILSRALNNRKYPSQFTSQIKSLAFKNNNLNAIEYIYKFQLEGSELGIKNSLKKYLGKSQVWPSEYDVIFDILLSFKDDELTQIVLDKLNELDENNKIYRESRRYDKILEKYEIKKGANNG